MRYYFPEKPFSRWFRQKQDCTKLPVLSAVSISKDAPKLKTTAKVAAAVAAKPVSIPNARAHAFLDQMAAVHKWLTVSPPPTKRITEAVASSAVAGQDKQHRPIDPFDLQDVPATLDAQAFKLAAALLRQWFGNQSYAVQSQAQKDCISGAPYYPADQVNASFLKHKDLLRVERVKLAYERIKTQEFLQSKAAHDALTKILRKTPAGTVDIDATQEFGGNLQQMHRKYAFASVTIGAQFPENFNDIRIEPLDKSKQVSDDLELALGEFRWYAAIDRAHVFYNGRTTRRIQVQSVAIYVMAPYGFDDFEQTIEYRGHFSKKHIALVTTGTWANYTVYSGKDMHAKNAVMWPVFNQDHRQWRDKHKQGGDMLLFSERMEPRIDAIDVVVPLQPIAPRFALLGRVAADFLGRSGIPYTALHFTLAMFDTEWGTVCIDGQPTLWEAGIKNTRLIRSNFYYDSLPTKIEIEQEFLPPAGMEPEEFAKRLYQKAQSFSSYTEYYSPPDFFVRPVMHEGGYNSNSYMAGLLHSVMGSVPDLQLSAKDGTQYQAPGWESPLPDSSFKGESIQ